MAARPTTLPALLAFDNGCEAGVSWVGRDETKPWAMTLKIRGAGDDYGTPMAAFERAVLDLIALHQPDAICYEAPLVIGGKGGTTRPTNIHTIRLAFGFATVIELCCARRAIPCYEGHIQSVRAHFVGTGRAGKDDVEAECRRRGWSPRTPDEADAMALLDYARHRLGRARAA